MIKNLIKNHKIKTLVFVFFAMLNLKANAQTQFQINGNGSQLSLGNECYRLTTASNNKFGSMWFRKKADLTKDFDMSANLNFGTNNGGADGIVFAFQNVCTSSGGGGGGIGIAGVSPSLSVEFDTYQNGEYNDPTNDHVGILKNGNVDHLAANSLVAPVSIDPANANVENGADWLVRILWTHTDSTLKVYVNNNLRISYTGNIVASIFGGSPYVYWGFTAATGGLNNEHKVCMVNFPTNVVKLDDIAICQGTSQQVNLPGGTTYSWSPNYNISNTSISNPLVFPDTTTSYEVSITDACGNIQKDTMIVTVNPKPIVSLNLPFNNACLNASPLTLSGGLPSGGTYSGSGVSGNQFNPTSAGIGFHDIIYSFTNTFGCIAKDTFTVEVKTAPNVTLGNFNSVCLNSSVISLSGGLPSGGTYSGSGVSGGNFNPALAGVGTHIITYTATNSNGCVGTATNSITVNPIYDPIISTPNGTVICNGNSINLNVNGVSGVSYQWFLNGTSVTSMSTSNTSFNATAIGSYTVVSQSSASCSDTSNAVVVTSGVNPSATITSSTSSFCPSNSILINSTLGSNETAAWYFNNTIISGQTGATLLVNQAGDYFVKITSSTGCSVSSNIISITQLSSINAAITSTQTTFCPGTTSISLNANGTNATYEWFEGTNLISGANSSIYIATNPGIYSCVITANSGCESTSNTITLISGSTPTAQLTTSDSTFCPGGNSTLVATLLTGATYNWFKDGNSISGTTNSINVNQAGSYTVQITNSEGCSNISNAINVTQNSAPTATISASNTVFCPGSNVTITANTLTGATYEWFRNSVSQGAPSSNSTFTATQGGTYFVKITNGCTSQSNSITITTGSLPGNVSTIFGNGTQCPGNIDDYSINSVSDATSYLWELIPANAGTIALGQGTTDVTIYFLNSNVTIKVTPINSCGNGGSKSEIVTIDNSFCFGPLFGGFSANTCIGSTVVFTNYTDPSQYFNQTPNWEFGAGANPATASGNGPFNVTYSTPGLKTVTLFYVDMFGNVTDFKEKVDYIFVSAPVTTSPISGQTTITSCSGVIETYSVTAVSGSTFQWTVPANATILSGQGTNSISVSFNGNGGNISVIQTNVVGCSAPSVVLNVDCTSNLNKMKDEISFELFPNPANFTLNLTIKDTENEEYKIYFYDIQGKEIVFEIQKIYGNKNHEFNISNLTNGMYFVKIQKGNYSEMKKFIKN